MALEGLDKVMKTINKQIAKMEEVVTTEALEDIGLDLLGKSVMQAPVDTGDMRGSGYVSFTTGKIASGTKTGSVVKTGEVGKRARPEVTVGFGVPYAAKQHEELGYKHPRGGKAKYLEDPLKENAGRYVDHIAKKAREVNK